MVSGCSCWNGYVGTIKAKKGQGEGKGAEKGKLVAVAAIHLFGLSFLFWLEGFPEVPIFQGPGCTTSCHDLTIVSGSDLGHFE